MNGSTLHINLFVIPSILHMLHVRSLRLKVPLVIVQRMRARYMLKMPVK